MSTYTKDQVYFCLNAISNISAAYNKNININSLTQSAISTVLADGTIQGLIGSWTPVWGPVVNTVGGNASNTMFVAKNTQTSEYVVAIAGTDPDSFYDWIVEDADVLVTVPWNILKSGCGNISLSMSTGLALLKGMQWKGQHLLDYLQSVNATNITVTGHSLGGALSPVMALFLSNNMGAGVNVSCRPTAGPTPGDATFATYWNNSEVGQNSNTVRVWNAFDVVPCAYENDTMQQIPDLYAPTIACPPDLTVTVNKMASDTAGKNYTQLLKNTLGFASSVYNQGNPAYPFPDQALYQHVAAYANFFKISDFQDQVKTLLNLNAPYFSGGTTVKQKQAAAATV